ncbi:MAG: alpha/beta hydrolase [Actinobacteria bacterium]|nr:alpha/beta hydrolase [Actinomycetota bacterium]
MTSIPVSINNDGVILRGEYKTPGESAHLIVLCHGIPLSEPDPDDGGYPLLADQLCNRGHASLFINFRGAGDSDGSFSIGGWYEDLMAIMEYARSELAYQSGHIRMAGFSAGGALAIKYAAEHKITGGIAVFAAPAWFTRIFVPEHLDYFFDIARRLGLITDPGFPPSNDWFIEDIRKNNAIDFVSRLSPQPLLIIHGDKDETVPVEHGEALFQGADDPKELIILKGSGHRLRRDPAALPQFFNWLEKEKERSG